MGRGRRAEVTMFIQIHCGCSLAVTPDPDTRVCSERGELPERKVEVLCNDRMDQQFVLVTGLGPGVRYVIIIHLMLIAYDYFAFFFFSSHPLHRRWYSLPIEERHSILPIPRGELTVKSLFVLFGAATPSDPGIEMSLCLKACPVNKQSF